MDTIVLARSRSRMFTAFVASDGRAILNIAARDGGVERSVSIPLDDAQRAVMARDDEAARVLALQLAKSGPRLDVPLPTPPAGIPVQGRLAA